MNPFWRDDLTLALWALAAGALIAWAVADSERDQQQPATYCPACLCAAREPDDQGLHPLPLPPGEPVLCQHHRRVMRLGACEPPVAPSVEEQEAMEWALSRYGRRERA